jgi:hypothetical protein
MQDNLCHPYILSTTVLSDTVAYCAAHCAKMCMCICIPVATLIAIRVIAYFSLINEKGYYAIGPTHLLDRASVNGVAMRDFSPLIRYLF